MSVDIDLEVAANWEFLVVTFFNFSKCNIFKKVDVFLDVDGLNTYFFIVFPFFKYEPIESLDRAFSLEHFFIYESKCCFLKHIVVSHLT